MVLKTRAEDEITLDLAKRKLLDDYQRHKNSQQNNYDSLEDVALKINRAKSTNPTVCKRIICHFYKMQGRLKRICIQNKK